MTRTCLIALTAGLLLATRAAAADPPPSPADAVDADYAAVLAAMKNPFATGILITEVSPGSAAEHAGLHAGDILTAYHGAAIRTLADLRTQVADAIAQKMDQAENPANQNAIAAALTRSDQAIVTLRRPSDKNDLQLAIAREPLGIRAIEVETGVPVPGNPPPSLRGSLKMNWDAILLNNTGDNASEGAAAFFRTESADGTPINWQRRTLRVVGENEVEAKFAVYRTDADPGEPPTESVLFQLRGGDYTRSRAFLLESIDVAVGGDIGDKSAAASLARRTGPVFKNESAAGKNDTPAPLDAAVGAAVPLIANAMPHEAGAVLPVHLVSIRDFIARPGYVLVTRGKVPAEIPTTRPAPRANAAPPLWRVDLLHCGVIVESYWFNDQHQLVRADIAGGTPMLSRRTPTEEAARAPAAKKS
jgi:hypothetical protein